MFENNNSGKEKMISDGDVEHTLMGNLIVKAPPMPPKTLLFKKMRVF
jgi:hypothetical protein